MHAMPSFEVVMLESLFGSQFPVRIAFCMMPIAFCRMPFAFCMMPIAFCTIPIAFGMIPIAFRMIPITFCMMPKLPVQCCRVFMPLAERLTWTA